MTTWTCPNCNKNCCPDWNSCPFCSTKRPEAEEGLYRLLNKGEILKEGDEVLFIGGDLLWHRTELEETRVQRTEDTMRVYRRRLPGRYRLLEEGEVLQKGDEVHVEPTRDIFWEDIWPYFFGTPAGRTDIVRRKIGE